MQLKIDASLKVPLHHQIGNGILSMVRSGRFKPGDRLFTEVGLAKKYSVSLGPVRQAINELVAQGMLERRRAKGVFLVDPRSRPSPKRRITFVTPDIGHSFYGAMVRGGEHCAREHGYEIVIANSDHDDQKETAILAQLAAMDPHIVVLCTMGGSSCRAELARLVEHGFLVVMVDRHFPDLSVDVIENDNVQIGCDATNYLIRLGHRHIVHLTIEASLVLRTLNSSDRQVGYEKAMAEAGLKPEIGIVQYPGDRWDVDDERRTLEWLRDHAGNLPSALFVLNDTLCIGVIRALRKTNLAIPEDISIVGCADLDFARMLTEPLTSVSQDSYGMGKRGVQLGIDRLEGRSPVEPVYEIHPHKLVERMTTLGRGTGRIAPGPGLHRQEETRAGTR
jgi:DNA-binding LacI/PurR family transcriptional regulator